MSWVEHEAGARLRGPREGSKQDEYIYIAAVPASHIIRSIFLLPGRGLLATFVTEGG